MLTLPSLGEIDRKLDVRIWLGAAAADLRKGFDSLAALLREGNSTIRCREISSCS